MNHLITIGAGLFLMVNSVHAQSYTCDQSIDQTILNELLARTNLILFDLHTNGELIKKIPTTCPSACPTEPTETVCPVIPPCPADAPAPRYILCKQTDHGVVCRSNAPVLIPVP